MKRIIVVSLIGFVTLGSGAQRASAWWPWDSLFSNHHCCAPICCKQYNAFSPFCCEGAGGSYPMPGNGYGGSPACSFSDGQGSLGELPAPGMIPGPAGNALATPPMNGGPIPNYSPSAPGNNAQAIPPGVPTRPWPAWGAGMMNPAAVPGYYPGSTSYGPPSGNGGPSYYPGFSGPGPVNGFGRY